MLLIWFIYVAVLNFSPVDLLADYFVPCDDGWFAFREKCLKLLGTSWKPEERTKWEKAEGRCNDDEGTLVNIQSKEELDFVNHFILPDATFAAWIGLRKTNNSEDFAWTDGSEANFTNWDRGQPTNDDNEECVAMIYDPARDILGTWDDLQCNEEFGFVCQKEINKRKKSYNPQFCTAEQGDGWKYQDTCYHIILEMKTWDSAEQHCKHHYGGHLATILDRGVDIYLDNILSSIKDQLWIGMKITDDLQQKWSSGWTVTYNRTATSYEEVEDGTCVLRRNRTVWNMAPCANKHPFICDTFKDPPVLKPPVNGSGCPDFPRNWIDLGGEYCYFFQIETNATWYEASYECEKRGGQLASIHSKEEAELIKPFVKYFTTTYTGFYIGLLRQSWREDVFMWADGSPMDYENWSYSQPNKRTEKCGEVWIVAMEWNDVECTDKKNYICSVKKVSPAIMDIEITACTSATSKNVVIGISVCIHLVLISLGVLVYCLRSRGAKRRKALIAAAVTGNALDTNRLKHRSRMQDMSKKENHHYEYPRFEEIREEHEYEEPVYA